MCQSAHAMYEGKNLHYASSDNKPLCSYSGKVCNQRRLNGYGFCVRHILEDKSAPYKQCAYVAKSSNQMCTQAIPVEKDQKYCSNHLIVLGLLPKKEKRPKKEKEVTSTQAENRLSFQDRLKSKINLNKVRPIQEQDTVLEDPNDPYAFPADVSVESQPPKPLNSVVPPSSNCESASKLSQLSPGATRSPSDSSSSVAKLYPELAERVRPKTESKGKGRHSSRSVKELSSKIAQKKLDKSKLRKSQDASLMEMSPSSHGSPDCGSGSLAAPSPGVSSSSVISPLSGPAAMGMSPLPPPPPPPHHYDGAVRSPLPLRGTSVVSNFTSSSSGLHLNHSAVSSQLHSPSSLPPPYPGSSAPLLGEQREASSSKHLLETSPSLKPSSSSSPSVPPPPAPPQPVVRLPPPPPYVPPSHSSPSVPVSSSPVLSSRPRQVKAAAEDKAMWTLFKVDAAVKFAKLSTQQKQYNTHLLGRGLCSSDESESDHEDAELQPALKYWFTPSSDDENNEDEDNEQDDDDNLQDIRTTKLALLRTRLRRQCHQARGSVRGNTALHRLKNKKTLLLVQAARQEPTSAVRALRYLHQKPGAHRRIKKRTAAKKWCCYKNEGDVQCRNPCLPATNHCLRHILYNVDQQLFDYCTAKFPDNTQCCVPVFDILHDFPLCPQHAAKADQQKAQEVEVKKRPRKKTKPPALTRPPKKGKKKKKGRNIRPEISVPPDAPSEELAVTSGDDREEVKVDEEMPSEEKMATDTEEVGLSPGEAVVAVQPPSMEPLPPVPKPAVVAPTPTPTPASLEPPPAPVVPFPPSKDTTKAAAEPFKDLVETFEMESELPLEQASRLLEEGDFQEVFNKLGEDAFGDIFTAMGKNGDFEPTREETEELERQLAVANNDVARVKEVLEKLAKSDLSDDINQFADTMLNSASFNLPQGSSYADLNPDNSPAVVRNILSTALSLQAQGQQAMSVPGSQDFLRQHPQPVPQPPTLPPPSQLQLPPQQQQQQQQNFGFVPSQSTMVSLSGINSAVNSVIGSQGVITSISPNGPTLGGSFPVGTGSQSVAVSSAHQRSFSSVPISLPGYPGGLAFGNLPQNVMLPSGSGSLLPNSSRTGATAGQLGLEPSAPLVAPGLPQQQPPPPPLHSGAILGGQMAGPRPGWAAQVNAPSINPAAYQNGFPIRPGYSGGPAMSVNQNTKFVPGGTPQGALGDFAAGKQDSLFPPISHSMGVPVITPPPTTQGYPNLSQAGSNFSSVPPPYTSS